MIKATPQLLEIGKAEVIADGTDVALIGPRFIKPLDTAVIQTYAAIATELPGLGALASAGLVVGLLWNGPANALRCG